MAEARDGLAEARDLDGAQRDEDAEQRDAGAAGRDLTGDGRDDAGTARDAAADARDDVASARDQDADQRDRSADQRDRDAATGGHLQHSAESAVAEMLESHREAAAADRHHAYDDRMAGADRRGLAAQDRATALADRVAGAKARDLSGLQRDTAQADRRTALADRVAGADGRNSSSADRNTAMADRDTALADRIAGASRRDSSGLDRDTALDDRAAAAGDRLSAMRYAALELKMTESEARAWRLLQAMPDPVIVADADGIIELINVQAVALFGYQPDELIGQPVERLIPVALHDGHRALRGAYVATDKPKPMSTGPDIVAVCKDGTVVPVEVNLSAITLSTGRAVLASIRDISDRKLADAELRISDERFRVSFDSAPIGMALIDLQPATVGRFLRVNSAMRSLTGYDDATLLATTSPAITHPDDRDDTTANLQRLTDGRITRWNTDKRYRTASGQDVWVHFAVSVVHDAEGRPSYGVSQVEDITDRKRAQAQMTERFHELANNVDVGFLIRRLDPPGYLYVNPAYLSLFGFDPDPDGPPPTPEASLAQVYPDDLERVTHILGSAEHGERVEEEWRFIRPDGQVRWVSGRVSAITDDDGVVRRIAGLFEDITDRKNAALTLRESEQRFTQLAESTEVGFALRNPTELLYANPSLVRIFGLDPSSPPSFSQLLALVHPDDLARAAANLAAEDRGERVESEVRVIRADGAVRLVRIVTDPVVTPDGEEDRSAITFTDVTDRRAAEDELRAARAEAERANEAKDEFLSRLSHELRTPLNAVLGFAQLLKYGSLSLSQDEAVSHILGGGRHLLAMIDDILDVTAIDAGRMALSPERVVLGELVRETIGLMQPMAAEYRIRLQLIAGAERDVTADRRRLQQVLLNLLSNAIKYNRPGGRVDIRASPLGNGEISIAVTDTGMGIPAADLPRLFDPFDRLGRQSTGIEGTGIGLPLAKRLVTLMGGRLGVDTEDGKGSTFTVTLPSAIPPDNLSLLDRALVDVDEAPARPATVTSSLLYIEDNPSNVDLLTAAIGLRPAWTLTHAANGISGLHLAASNTPTAILLDLHLPDMHGAEVLQALKNDPATADVAVAILSADASTTRMKQLLAAGAQRYLTKPLDLDELFVFLDANAETPQPGSRA